MYSYYIFLMYLMGTLCILLANLSYESKSATLVSNSVGGPTGMVFGVPVIYLVIALWLISVDRKAALQWEAMNGHSIDYSIIDPKQMHYIGPWVAGSLLMFGLCITACVIAGYLRPSLINFLGLAFASLGLFGYLWFYVRGSGEITTLVEYRRNILYELKRESAICLILFSILFTTIEAYVELVANTKNFVYACFSLALVMIISFYWNLKMPGTMYMQYSPFITSIMAILLSLVLLIKTN